MKMIKKTTKGIAWAIIIVFSFGLLSSFWLSFSVIIPLLASIGGMIVFFGLWLEKEADEDDKKEHLSNFTDDKRWLRLKSEIGWWILMFGIGVEIMTAAGLAVREEYENRQAAKNNPINLPVSDISGTARVDIEGTISGETPAAGIVVDTSLELLEKDISVSTLNLEELKTLVAHNIELFEHMEFSSRKVTYRGYVIEFQKNPIPLEPDIKIVEEKAMPTVKQTMEKIKVLRIHTTYIPKDAEVIGGKVQILINGSFPMNFNIYRQKTDKFLSELNPSDKGFFLYATNSIP